MRFLTFGRTLLLLVVLLGHLPLLAQNSADNSLKRIDEAVVNMARATVELISSDSAVYHKNIDKHCVPCTTEADIDDFIAVNKLQGAKMILSRIRQKKDQLIRKFGNDNLTAGRTGKIIEETGAYVLSEINKESKRYTYPMIAYEVFIRSLNQIIKNGELPENTQSVVAQDAIPNTLDEAFQGKNYSPYQDTVTLRPVVDRMPRTSSALTVKTDLVTEPEPASKASNMLTLCLSLINFFLIGLLIYKTRVFNNTTDEVYEYDEEIDKRLFFLENERINLLNRIKVLEGAATSASVKGLPSDLAPNAAASQPTAVAGLSEAQIVFEQYPVFDISPIGLTEANFRVSSNPELQKLVLSNPPSYLNDICIFLNHWEQSRRIVTDHPGKLVLQGDRWIVTERAQIRFF